MQFQWEAGYACRGGIARTDLHAHTQEVLARGDPLSSGFSSRLGLPAPAGNPGTASLEG